MSGDLLPPIQTQTRTQEDDEFEYLGTDPLSAPDFSAGSKEKEDDQSEEKVEWTMATKLQLILALMVVIISICAVAIILATVSDGKMNFRHIHITYCEHNNTSYNNISIFLVHIVLHFLQVTPTIRKLKGLHR